MQNTDPLLSLTQISGMTKKPKYSCALLFPLALAHALCRFHLAPFTVQLKAEIRYFSTPDNKQLLIAH